MNTYTVGLVAIFAWIGLYVVFAWQYSRFGTWWSSYNKWLLLAITGIIFSLGFICFQTIFLETELTIRLTDMIVEIPLTIFISVASFLPWLVFRRDQTKSLFLFYILDCLYWLYFLGIIIGGFSLCKRLVIPIVVRKLQLNNISQNTVFTLVIVLFCFTVCLLFGLLFFSWQYLRRWKKSH